MTDKYAPKSIISRVSKVSEPEPLRLLLYGPPGSGKTTYGASGPKTLLVAAERGTMSIRKSNVSRFVMDKWSDIEDVYYSLATEDHPYETVTLDTVTALQEHAAVAMGLLQDLMENTDPRRTYGKIGAAVRNKIVQFGTLPMNVVFTAQVKYREETEGPDAGEYPLVPDITPSIYKTLTAVPDVIGRTFIRDTGTQHEWGIRFGPDYRSFTKQRDLDLPDELMIPKANKDQVMPMILKLTQQAQEA